ncbi:MAG: hypothetical protein ACYC99_04315 [Candidatus Geothermincolia bacterium]
MKLAKDSPARNLVVRGVIERMRYLTEVDNRCPNTLFRVAELPVWPQSLAERRPQTRSQERRSA